MQVREVATKIKSFKERGAAVPFVFVELKK